jgi:CheY-like chemotaxis protein
LSEEPGPRYLILIVDDVPDERAAVSQVLEGAGYSTRSVPSGEATLDCAVAIALSHDMLESPSIKVVAD